jgi:Family of unknown function (DUF5397)
MTKSAVQERPAHQELEGKFRRFGQYGVVYQVLKIDDDTYATIRVVESGETLKYAIRKILAEPNA